jgi:hypothetical protein
VNGAAGSCAQDDGTGCTFAFSASATALPSLAAASPTTLSFTAVDAALNLTLSGSGFGTAAEAVTVTVGRATCTVLAITDAQLTCRVAAAAARAGTRAVVLMLRGVGQASGNVTVTIRTLTPGGLSVGQLASTGASLLNITGSGFESSSCDLNQVTIGGVRCAVAGCGAGYLTAVFPGGAAPGPAAVRVSLLDDTGAEVDAASYSVDNATLQVRRRVQQLPPGGFVASSWSQTRCRKC